MVMGRTLTKIDHAADLPERTEQTRWETKNWCLEQDGIIKNVLDSELTEFQRPGISQRTELKMSLNMDRIL